MSVQTESLVGIDRVVLRSNIRRFLEETARFYASRLLLVDADLEVVVDLNGSGSPAPAELPIRRDGDTLVSDSPLARPIVVYDTTIGFVVASPEDSGSESSARAIAHHASELVSELAVKEYELNDLSREILDSYEEVNLFYRISSALGTARDIEGVCSVILRNVCEIIRVNRASILLLDEKGSELYVAAAVGIPDEDLSNIRVRVGEGISGKVLKSRTPQLVDDVCHLPQGLLSGYEEYATRSFISVPLCVDRGASQPAGVLNLKDRSFVADAGGRAIGVINMTDKAGNASFTSGDLKLLTALGSQAAVLIENIRLIEFEKELRIARDIQRSLLPEAPPDVPGLDLAGACVPARNVGGDYYDHLLRGDDGSMAAVIADVSGHNVASALMMAVARSALRSELRRQDDPGEVLRRLNVFMYDDLSRAELFLSALCCVYQPETRVLKLANAGHNPALLRRPSEGGTSLLDADGLLSGIVPDGEYPPEEYRLEPGDVVLMYTDGIVEAMDPSGIMFGMDRLADALERHHGLPAAAIIERIFEEVYAFSGEGVQSDDMTAVVLKVEEPGDR